jgi:hypothetical protein
MVPNFVQLCHASSHAQVVAGVPLSFAAFDFETGGRRALLLTGDVTAKGRHLGFKSRLAATERCVNGATLGDGCVFQRVSGRFMNPLVVVMCL